MTPKIIKAWVSWSGRRGIIRRMSCTRLKLWGKKNLLNLCPSKLWEADTGRGRQPVEDAA